MQHASSLDSPIRTAAASLPAESLSSDALISAKGHAKSVLPTLGHASLDDGTGTPVQQGLSLIPGWPLAAACSRFSKPLASLAQNQG
eukprot:COSAG01_NODE_4217_length_5230_cov_15.531280_1_plen_87_part_00